MKYLAKFLPSTAEVCEPLKKNYIIKIEIDMEQDVPNALQQSQEYYQKRRNHDILTMKKSEST